MRKVQVIFEVSFTQITDVNFLGSAKPDFIFQGDFDKDDDKSFSEMCDLDYKVESLVKSLKSLNCQVVAVRKEVTCIELD